MYMTALAEALRRGGQHAEALAIARQAISSCQETGQTTYLPQAQHALGTILLDLSARAEGGGTEEAVNSIGKALSSARDMGAPLLELGPAVSLAKIYNAQGRMEEAHTLLNPVHAGFVDEQDFPLMTRATETLAALR